MALQDMIERLQYHARNTTGVKIAPDYVDAIAGNSTVYALSFAQSGEFGAEAEKQGRDFHNLITQIVIEGADIVSVEHRSEGIVEEFVDKLRNDPTLNGTIETIVGAIEYQIAREIAQERTTMTIQITTRVKNRPVF